MVEEVDEDFRGLLAAEVHRGFLCAVGDCRGFARMAEVAGVTPRDSAAELAEDGCRGFARMAEEVADVALRDAAAELADNGCRGFASMAGVALRDAVELAGSGCRGLLADHGCRGFARMAKEADSMWLVVVVGSSRR
jgi:hypothetical protein